MITRRDFIKVAAAGGALATLGDMPEAKAAVKTIVPDPAYCYESEKKIPVIAEVDLVVVGGSSAAVAAATAASKAGRKVFLFTPLSYLGDDICGSFQYHLKKDEKPVTALSQKIFVQKKEPTPLHVKQILENELIDNDVVFLYNCFLTNVLQDNNHAAAGVVFANRSGRQAVACKGVIDATLTAVAARMFGLQFSPFVTGKQRFEFTVVGNSIKKAPELLSAELLPYKMKAKGKEFPVVNYAFEHELKSDTYASLMEVEQKIRDITWDADQGDSSDLLWYVPQQKIIGQQSYTNTFTSVRDIPLQAFTPQNKKNIWILGPSLDADRKIAEVLMRPVNALLLGDIMGELVAARLADTSMPSELHTVQSNAMASDYGLVGELLNPLRPSMRFGFAQSERGALPVLGTYDVVILGGGTVGAPAGIAASRQGAKTLVIEQLHGLGGMGTLGLIGRYWDGYRDGFSSEIDLGVKDMAPEDHPRQQKNWKNDYNSDWKQEWYRREIRRAGGEIWFGAIGCGAVIKNNVITGVVVATPWGRGVILCRTVIDSTGSADIAIAAGAPFEYTGKRSIAVQGAGLSHISPTDYYNNNDWAFIDDSDMLDVTRMFVQAKVKNEGAYDIVKLPQTRERRRVIGDHIVSVYDVLNHRRYPDTISYHKSSFDTHGMIVDPFFILSPPLARHTIYEADVPLRSLLPSGLDGILTTGLGASAHRDAMPVIRMQSCLQNQGYAVGYLAALAAKENKMVRKVDFKKVQRHLVGIGNLPQRVLTDKEFKGFSNKEMELAAQSIPDDFKGLEKLLTDHKRCIPLVNKQLSQCSDAEAKVKYASILCILGESSHVTLLEDKIKSYPQWDKGWHYTGMGQFGMSMSTLDALIIALGKAKQTSSLPVILEKARLLEPDDYFSHFRAIALATESIRSGEAVAVLAELLSKPGIRYHHIANLKDARNRVVPGSDDVSTRNRALKELHLARALYGCGDQDGMGEKILKKYAEGLQGHYARYANEILQDQI